MYWYLDIYNNESSDILIIYQPTTPQLLQPLDMNMVITDADMVVWQVTP